MTRKRPCESVSHLKRNCMTKGDRINDRVS